MSRSILSTEGEYRRRKRYRYADAEARERDLEEIADDLRAKRALKRRVRRERADPRPAEPPPVDPGTIPIRFVEHGPAICYAVSEADLRAVLSGLPAGVCTGLAGITLCVGAEYQKRDLDPDEAERDPWLGRLGHEMLPGVWAGRFLGTYFPEPTRIDLYAYAVDPDLPDRATWELLLRLWMLSTFVHEVAHHDDEMRRTGRGRWHLEPGDKAEAYAVALQAEWARDVVVPYLERAYPAEVAALNAWMERHAGLALPLALVAGDWRWNEAGELRRIFLFGSARLALAGLAADLHGGEEPLTARVEFARELHYGANYAEAQAALATVVAAEPGHLDATTLQADILEHLGDYRGAEALARRVVERDDRHVDAWGVLADVYEAQGDWPQACEAAGRGWAAADPEKYEWAALLLHRARALLEQGDYAATAADLDRLEERRPGWQAQSLRALLLLRSGQFAEALAVAEAARGDPPRTWRRVAWAVRFEASARLGRPLPPSELGPDALAALRRMHHGAWVDRLVGEFGLSEEE